MKNIFLKISSRIAAFSAVMAITCAGAWCATAADAPTTQKATIIGVQLVPTRSQSMRYQEGTASRVKTVNTGDIIEVVAVKNADKPAQEGNVVLVEALTGAMGKEILDLGLKAYVHDGAIEFMDNLYDNYVPLPAKKPDWLDDSKLPPKAKADTPLETLKKALESESQDWQIRFHAALALQIRSEKEPSALESLARATGDSRREIRQVAAVCLRRTRTFGTSGGREYPITSTRKPELLAQLAPILVEQLQKQPNQTLIVDLLRAGGKDVVPTVVKLIEPPYSQPVACSAASILYDFPTESKQHTALLWKAMAAGNDWALMTAYRADLDGTLGKLVEQLQSNDEATRRRSAQCLLKMGPLTNSDLTRSRDTLEKTVDALRKGIRSNDAPTARACVRTLPWFGILAKPALTDLEKLAEQIQIAVPEDEIQDAMTRIRKFEN